MKTSDILSKQQLMEFGVLFGPPPVLTTEETQHYEEVWRSLIESLKPRDFLELLLIKQVQTETWKILRYTRHQSVGIERRFRQSLRFQIQRRKEQKARREMLARELAEKTGRPITDFERLIHLDGVVESSVYEVDQILERTPTELAHNEALEAGIAFQEQLDRLIDSAVRRRNQALQVLELYREGLGQHWRKISDEIIDAAASEIGAPAKAIEAPPLSTEAG
ncbi:MAG: hypothetical protein ACLQLC_04540 [Candidatus Sulfotelmatobacter sp.]